MGNRTGNQEWFAVVNPNAGSGKGKKDWDRIAVLLARNGVSVNFRFTERKGQGIEHAIEAIAEGYKKILSVGGDGTLNEVVNGAFSQDFCKPGELTLGLIPVGTGNDWGRMFGIPLVYEGAIQVITEGKVMSHDIGVVEDSEGGAWKKRYFINIAGLGFESIVVKKTNKQKDKGNSSKAIYFYNLLSSLLLYRNIPVEIIIDGIKSSLKVFSINVGNGRYCGGGMRQTPDAVPDDGLLDITVIKGMSKFEVVRSLKLLYDGTILSHPKVDGFRTVNLKVESGSPVYLEADGESLGHTPATFSIIPGAINVVYGTKLIQ